MYLKTAEQKKDVKCPKCQTPLANTDSYEVNYEDNKFEAWSVGYCHHCRNFYQWSEVYKFDHITEPEQMVDGAIED